MAIKIPTFDYATCIACNICADICPLSCIDMKKISPGNLKKSIPDFGITRYLHRLFHLYERLSSRFDYDEVYCAG